MSAHAVHSAIAGDSVSLRKVRRALVSVFDKTGVEELGLFLAAQGVEILSTGGTAKKLRAAGVAVIDASAYTGSVRPFPSSFLLFFFSSSFFFFFFFAPSSPRSPSSATPPARKGALDTVRVHTLQAVALDGPVVVVVVVELAEPRLAAGRVADARRSLSHGLRN